MPLVVEDGTGIQLADAYVSAQRVAEYALDNGRLWMPESDALGDAAVRAATRYVDGTYRARFPGYKLRGRDQGLEWPRLSAYVMDSGVSGWGYVTLPADQVPREIVQAVCEGAIRELASPGTLSPDLDAGAAIQNVQAGSVSVTFAGGGLTDRKVFQAIDLILGTLLPPVEMYSGRVGRG